MKYSRMSSTGVSAAFLSIKYELETKDELRGQ